MAQIDEVITTYLSAVETEGKAERTIQSYGESLRDFRRVGRRLGFPESVNEYEVSHVYAFLADIRKRSGRGGGSTSSAYQNHHHRTLKAFFSWCRLVSDTESLLAELEAQAQRAEATAQRMLTFAVEPADESAVEEAIALVADGLGGRNRRGRALALLCRRELERSGD